MSKNAVVSARISEEIKNEANLVLKSIGLTPSDAIRLMMIRVAREKAMPFDIWVPNAETVQAISDERNGKMESFSDIDSLMADIHRDD